VKVGINAGGCGQYFHVVYYSHLEDQK